jgi:hypothetical protein
VKVPTACSVGDYLPHHSSTVENLEFIAIRRQATRLHNSGRGDTAVWNLSPWLFFMEVITGTVFFSVDIAKSLPVVNGSVIRQKFAEANHCQKLQVSGGFR